MNSMIFAEKAPASNETAEQDYRELRYRLGVPEGSAEFGVGKAIPLECNGDYLKAISFEKGCYIGQELTARAYHTGEAIQNTGRRRIIKGVKSWS